MIKKEGKGRIKKRNGRRKTERQTRNEEGGEGETWLRNFE